MTQTETPEIGDATIHEMISQVIHRQTRNIDIISGSSFSSEAIIADIKVALAEAGADVEGLVAIEYEEEKDIKKQRKAFDLSLFLLDICI